MVSNKINKDEFGIYAICDICNTKYYADIEYESHGCLGEEKMLVFNHECDNNKSYTEDDFIDDSNIPF